MIIISDFLWCTIADEVFGFQWDGSEVENDDGGGDGDDSFGGCGTGGGGNNKDDDDGGDRGCSDC